MEEHVTMKLRYAYPGVALVLTLALFAQGFTGASARTATATKLKGPIKIGQITSLTGPYAVYGVMQEDGFKAGLAYATKGTNKVLGAKIQVTTVSDVSSTTSLPDPTVATADAKTLIEQDHVNIIQCCASSATAYAVAGLMPTYKLIDMVAPAADDTLTGVNRYTFRTSREDSQDAKTGASYAVKTFGKNYMTIAQNYSFGQNQEKVWNAALSKLGANDMGDILFPLNATDFTPYIQQILNKKPKWLFVACAGTQCTGLFNQIVSSGLANQVKIMTGLPNVAAIPSFGSAGTKMGFISVYYYTFPKTKANVFLKSYIQKHYHRPADIFDQDSFAAAQQLVAAIKKARSLSASKLIKALEGQSVNGPKGVYTIRKADHLCLQPMYVAKLVDKGGKLTPVLLKTLTPKQAAPGVQAHNW
jgi:branched-chain amino acid transport system substrate-binding protein